MPSGSGPTVACGTVSATERSNAGFNRIEDFVQTDAAVNPGMSGGALIGEDGRLVGILSAIFTKQSDANIGVNFAVSAALAEAALARLDGSRPGRRGPSSAPASGPIRRAASRARSAPR